LVFSRYSKEAEQVSKMLIANHAVTETNQEQLAAIWNRMWLDVRKELDESSWTQIALNLEQ